MLDESARFGTPRIDAAALDTSPPPINIGRRLAPNHLVPGAIGLYDPSFEHDACGVGFVAQIDGTPSHRILEIGIRAVGNVMHRGAVDADARTGDGAGVLTQIPRALIVRELARRGVTGVDPADIAVAMVFFPNDPPALVDTLSLIHI